MSFGKLGTLGQSYGSFNGSAASGPSAYLGAVATRGQVPTSFNAGFTAWMTRSYHKSRDTISALQILVPNFYVDTTTHNETGTGGTTTITASVEYPAGTFTQIKFGGSASRTIASGTYVVSDSTAVAIPNNTSFWIRMYMPNAAGQVLDGFGTAGSAALGDLCNNFDGDKTMSGTVSNQFAGYTTAPLAIIAQTKRPSVLCVGTSRVQGINDTQDSSGDMGIICRSIGPSFAYSNFGVASDTISSFIASHTNRVAISQYFSHVIVEGPTNEIAVTNANQQIFWNYFASQGKKVFAVTCDPSTTGAWTLANQTDQTVGGIGDSYRTVNNPYLLSLPSPLLGCFDITTVTSTGVTSKWNADGTAAKWTSDGIHESQFANLAIQASGIIPASAIHR